MTARERELLRQRISEARRQKIGRSLPWSDLCRDGRRVHPDETRASAIRLHDIGHGANAIARALGVPRTTVSYWLNSRPWDYRQSTATGPEVLDGLVGASRRTECTA